MRIHPLSLRGISEAFRDRRNVDFETLGPGLIAIVGENGAGKSTTVVNQNAKPLRAELLGGALRRSTRHLEGIVL